MAVEERAYTNFQLFTNFVLLFSQFDWPDRRLERTEIEENVPFNYCTVNFPTL